MPGIGSIASLPAVARTSGIPAGGSPYLLLFGYLFILVFLVVLGIWGFRIGSGRHDGGGGGGPKRPDVGTPPPSGGEQLTDDDFAAWEEECRGREDEHATAPRR